MVNGKTQLQQWLKRKGLSQQKLADLVGVHQGAVWYWLNGQRTPGREAAIALETVTDIPVEAWRSKGAA